jgi:hypothetical protein
VNGSINDAKSAWQGYHVAVLFNPKNAAKLNFLPEQCSFRENISRT